MNFTKVILIVFSLHIVVVGLLFQQGCQTTSHDNATAISDKPLLPPTRPSETAVSETPVNEEKAAEAVIESHDTYKVKNGDNLWSIAKKEQVSIKSLMDANGLHLNSALKPGMELKIPSKNGEIKHESSAIDGEKTTYVVKKGDSLSRISAITKVSLATLKKVNKIHNNSIFEGQKLIIPGKHENLGSASVKAVKEQKKSATPILTGEKYTVAKGDNLSTIAKKHGMTVSQLKSLNNLNDKSILKIGQVLHVKGDKSVTEKATESKNAPVVTTAPAATSETTVNSTTGQKTENSTVAAPSVEDESIFDSTEEVPVVPVQTTEPAGEKLIENKTVEAPTTEPNSVNETSTQQ